MKCEDQRPSKHDSTTDSTTDSTVDSTVDLGGMKCEDQCPFKPKHDSTTVSKTDSTSRLSPGPGGEGGHTDYHAMLVDRVLRRMH